MSDTTELGYDPLRLTTPRRYLVRMVVFLLLAGFLLMILAKDLQTAFMANPGLNGLIIGCLAVGILLSLWQVIRLFREVRWINELRGARPDLALQATPSLLAPIATLLGDKAGRTAISTSTLRSVLDSVGMRLDEMRDVSRYLTGLLVFLGLLGTFWGLLETVGSVGKVIGAMQTGKDAAVLFDELKAGLQAPLVGMGISFSSSLFGLAGSLVLGFLDLQAGQAQTRFYTELEDWLSTTATDAAPVEMGDLSGALDKLNRLIASQTGSAVTNNSLASLAEGIQQLVQHMRLEQQQIRDWVEAQSESHEDVKKLLTNLMAERERN
ncbi:MAG: flagellar motor protein MotA [Methylocystis sp.]|nr:flagellar motor protein MotA [Methylocystis sp.]MCA3582310.1 flagellar motor protein MotA [Methylocystis sp.]MCA3588205.1 flagellar motor protein MotA [Methylocystis sp.]MCA3590123.1 flagellar motor protein MotA [Methylocystis sp.]